MVIVTAFVAGCAWQKASCDSSLAQRHAARVEVVPSVAPPTYTIHLRTRETLREPGEPTQNFSHTLNQVNGSQSRHELKILPKHRENISEYDYVSTKH